MDQIERIYTVTGMHCASCALNIRDELRELAGVEEATVDLEAERVTVVGDGFTDDAVRAAVRQAGYEVAV
jgi:copper chaperone CopZ